MKAQYSNPVRFGTLTIPIAGVLFIVGILLRGPLQDPSLNPQAFAQIAAAPNFQTAWIVIILGEIVALFGYLALYGVLSPNRDSRMTLAAMVLVIAGTALFLSLTGFMAFVAPVIGRLYLQGQTNVLPIAVAGFFGGPVLSFLYPSGILGAIGSILFGIAIWRSGTLPKWTSIPFALSIILLAFAPAFSIALELLGAVFQFASGAGIVAKVWRE